MLYSFCYLSTWIRHRYTRVPHPEPFSLLPPRTIPLGSPSAPAPSIQCRASNLEWQLVSYDIIYVSMSFSQIIPPCPSPTESIRLIYTSVSLLLYHIQGYQRRQWHPTPVLLPGKSHGQRSLVGYSPWGHEESDMTEWLNSHFSLSCIGREMATHSSVLAWRISGTAEPGGLLSIGLHRVRHDWSNLAVAYRVIVTIFINSIYMC